MEFPTAPDVALGVRSRHGATARRATPEDVDILVGLMSEFYAESDFALDAVKATKAFDRLLSDDRLGAVWVLSDGARVAGYVVLTVCYSMEAAGLTGYIDDLFVRAGHRRRGMARTGLHAVIAECRRRGVATLQVVVGAESSGAYAFYSTCGFVPPSDDRRTMARDLS